VIVGTAGHIDHGKTSLVRSLTGVETDRLKEEKARGISIELGYAFLPLPDGGILGFIDVPGHERLIHTMIAGVGGIDLALLVVAADDGVMPQTREHVEILSLLGIRGGAIAITKVDRTAPERLADVHREIDALLGDTALQFSARYSVNATDDQDDGISQLRTWLTGEATKTAARDSDGPFRLALDRVFTLAGRGTIVTGTVRSGRVEIDDELTVMPAGIRGRVRSIHTQNREATAGFVGERCALNLTGVAKEALSRGDWLCAHGALQASTRFDVRLPWLDADAPPARTNAVHIHWGTSDRIARIVHLREVPDDRGRVLAQLIFDAPVCAAPGDAFIIRDAQAARTLGGGMVLDPNAPSRHRCSADRLAYLAGCQAALAGEGIEALLRASRFGVALSEIARVQGTSELLLRLPADARIVAAGAESIAIVNDHWQTILHEVRDRVARFHTEQPEEPGVERSRLRRMVYATMSGALWHHVIESMLTSDTLALTRHWLRLPEHRAHWSDAEQALVQRLQPHIAAARFEAMWVRDLAVLVGASEQTVRQTLVKHAMRGGVYQIVRDLFYDEAVILELRDALHTVESRDGAIHVSQYRDVIGVGRKRTIQILEFFDRVGYTRRAGVSRVVRADHPRLESA